MNVREMHYDFKQKLNKIDSQQDRDLKVPEIDWKLNEAQELFCKIIAEPRLGKQLGFEMNQRTIDDVRTIVVNQKFVDGLVANKYDAGVGSGDGSYVVILPDDYWFYIGSRVYASKGGCNLIRMSVKEIQHDDESELSPFDKSSWLWRVVNIRFIDEGIRIFTDEIFTIDKMCLEYLRKPRTIYNAADWVGNTYTGLDGVVYVGTQDCELPIGTHREIVDMAVMIAAGDLSSNYQVKQNKVRLNN